MRRHLLAVLEPQTAPASGGQPLAGGDHSQVLQLVMFAGSCALVLGAGLLLSSLIGGRDVKNRTGVGVVLLVAGGVAVCVGLYG